MPDRSKRGDKPKLKVGRYYLIRATQIPCRRYIHVTSFNKKTGEVGFDGPYPHPNDFDDDPPTSMHDDNKQGHCNISDLEIECEATEREYSGVILARRGY